MSHKELVKHRTFVVYIRGICCGPLLAITVHEAVLEGSCCFGAEILQKWQALVADVGMDTATEAVANWINQPYRLG